MAIILKGDVVAQALNEESSTLVDELKNKGIIPKLVIIRVGEKKEDLAYERGAKKSMEKVGVLTEVKVLPEDISQDEMEKVILEVNSDESAHGILLFRPLPKTLDEEKIISLIAPEKDVDCANGNSLVGVFTGKGGEKGCFAPCTARAAMEILKYYDIEISGKKAVVLGRSLVIGKPVAMMLLDENATVTICHSKTENMEKICSEADILVSAMGRLKSVNENHVNTNQVIIDVGINWDAEKGGISGDVDFNNVENSVKAITPVPGGVGGVTSSVLANHVVKAAQIKTNFKPNREDR